MVVILVGLWLWHVAPQMTPGVRFLGDWSGPLVGLGAILFSWSDLTMPNLGARFPAHLLVLSR